VLQVKEHKFQEAEEANTMAMVKIPDRDGTLIKPEDLQPIRRKAQIFLKKYCGRKKQINGQQFINFEDYYKWRGRKVKRGRRC
jgi:hypothetical protein